jgi:hypothetical protein
VKSPGADDSPSDERSDPRTGPSRGAPELMSHLVVLGGGEAVGGWLVRTVAR